MLTLATTGNIVLEVLFWVFLVLAAVAFGSAPESIVGKNRYWIVLVEILILGLVVFHNPFNT